MCANIGGESGSKQEGHQCQLLGRTGNGSFTFLTSPALDTKLQNKDTSNSNINPTFLSSWDAKELRTSFSPPFSPNNNPVKLTRSVIFDKPKAT